jgi:hypothetical protein
MMECGYDENVTIPAGKTVLNNMAALLYFE